MRVARFVFFGSLVFLASSQLDGQQNIAAQRDPQALSILTQVLAASGGSVALSSVQDFTGSGTITNYWAGAEVKAPVTLRSKGPQECRLDANLPEGTKSWAVSYGQGSLQEPSGEKTSIPFSNSWNLGYLSAPQLAFLAALNDSSISVVQVTQPIIGNRQVYDIRLQKSFANQDDPTGELSKWTTKDYFVDPTTLTIVATQDAAYSNDSPRHSFKHQVAFSDYRSVNGVLFPFAIAETIEGQQTWSIQLSSITLNNGLTDSIFQL
ncbi:MAG: hypothetical protein WB994_07170 [Candidatus Acidiferrum sp.]